MAPPRHALDNDFKLPLLFSGQEQSIDGYRIFRLAKSCMPGHGSSASQGEHTADSGPLEVRGL